MQKEVGKVLHGASGMWAHLDHEFPLNSCLHRFEVMSALSPHVVLGISEAELGGYLNILSVKRKSPEPLGPNLGWYLDRLHRMPPASGGSGNSGSLMAERRLKTSHKRFLCQDPDFTNMRFRGHTQPNVQLNTYEHVCLPRIFH